MTRRRATQQPDSPPRPKMHKSAGDRAPNSNPASTTNVLMEPLEAESNMRSTATSVQNFEPMLSNTRHHSNKTLNELKEFGGDEILNPAKGDNQCGTLVEIHSDGQALGTSFLARLPSDILENVMDNFNLEDSQDLEALRHVARKISRGDRVAMDRYVFKTVYMSFDTSKSRHREVLKYDIDRFVKHINANAQELVVHYTPDCYGKEMFQHVFNSIELPNDSKTSMKTIFTPGSTLDKPTIRALNQALLKNTCIDMVCLPGYCKYPETARFAEGFVRDDIVGISPYFYGRMENTTKDGRRREVFFGTGTPSTCLRTIAKHDKAPAKIDVIELSGDDEEVFSNLGHQFNRMGCSPKGAHVETLIVSNMSLDDFEIGAIDLQTLKHLDFSEYANASQDLVLHILCSSVALETFRYPKRWDYTIWDPKFGQWERVKAGRKSKGGVELIRIPI